MEVSVELFFVGRARAGGFHVEVVVHVGQAAGPQEGADPVALEHERQAVKPGERAVAGDVVHPLTQTTWRSSCKTSTRSFCASMTRSMGL